MARADDLAADYRPPRFRYRAAALHTSRMLWRCPIPARLFPLLPNRAKQFPRSRSTRPSAFLELLFASQSTLRPAHPISLFYSQFIPHSFLGFLHGARSANLMSTIRLFANSNFLAIRTWRKQIGPPLFSMVRRRYSP